MKTTVCTLTERGQVSVPAAIRKEMGLHPGQRLRWEQISKGECRVTIIEEGKRKGPLAMLGFATQIKGRKQKRTADWMRELREGDK